jgi:hypothetical protein
MELSWYVRSSNNRLTFADTNRIIFQVDFIPVEQMTLLCQVGNCRIWDNASSVLDELQIEQAAGTKRVQDWLHVSKMERSTVSKERKFRIIGIHRRRIAERELSGDGTAFGLHQVLLHGSNSHELKLVVNLLKKSLAALSGCFWSRTHRRSQISIVKGILPDATAVYSLILCRGGGAAEGFWAHVMSRVAKLLLVAPSVHDTSSMQGEKSPADAISAVVFHSISSRMRATYNAVNANQWAVLCTVMSGLCSHIAAAYQKIFLLSQCTADTVSSRAVSSSLLLSVAIQAPTMSTLISDGNVGQHHLFSARLFWSSKYPLCKCVRRINTVSMCLECRLYVGPTVCSVGVENWCISYPHQVLILAVHYGYHFISCSIIQA